MAKKVIWTKNFEDFKGLDLRSSPLTIDPNSALELTNYRSSEGGSIQGAEGYSVRANYGPIGGLHNYIKLNRQTGATEEELVACNNYLWRLKEFSFSFTDASFSGATVDVYIDSSFNFKVDIDSVNDFTLDVEEGTNFTSSNIAGLTIWELCNSLAGSYTVTYPIKSGKINNAVTNIESLTPVVFDSGHTLAIYDSSFYYRSAVQPCAITPFYVQRLTAANTYQISTYYDEQNGAGVIFNTSGGRSRLFGPGSVQASAITRVERSGDVITCYFYSWDPIPQGLPQMGNSGGVDATRNAAIYNYPVMDSWFYAYENSNVQMPSMSNLRDVCYVGHQYVPGTPLLSGGVVYYDQGKPDLMRGRLLKYDGQVVRAAGTPPPRSVSAVAVGSGGSLSAGAYRWRVRFRLDDAQGNTYYSTYLDTDSITCVSNDSATVTYSPFLQSELSVTTTADSRGSIIPINTAALAAGSLRIGDILALRTNDIARVYTVQQIFNTQVVVNPAPSSIIPSGSSLLRVSNLPYCPRFAVATATTAPSVSTETINGESVRIAKLEVKRGHGFTDEDFITLSSSTLIPIEDDPKAKEQGLSYEQVSPYRVQLLSREDRLAITSSLSLDETHLVWNADVWGDVGTLSTTSITEGMLVEIYRTNANGADFYLETITAFSHLSTNAHTSTKADSALGALFIDQPFGQEFDLPPRGHLLSTHQSCLTVAGEEPNSIRWSLPGEHEYFPLATNLIDIESSLSGEIRATRSDSANRLLVFKKNGHYEVIGDLTTPGGSQSITIAEGDYGISSHHSLVKMLDFVVGVGTLGFVFLVDGKRALELSSNIDPAITGESDLVLERAVSFSDPLWRELISSIPYTSSSLTITTTPSLSFAFDWENPPRWYKRSLALPSSGAGLINQQGGIAFYDNKIWHLSNPDPDGTHAGVLWERHSPYTDSTTLEPLRISRFTNQGENQTYTFTPAWIHLGEPSLYKMFKRIRLWSIPISQNWPSFTPSLVGKRNYNTTTTYDSFSFDELLNGRNWSTKHLLTNSKLLSFTFTLSANSTNPPFITGYEIVADIDYEKEDFLP